MPQIVAIGMTRELGPVLGSLMVASYVIVAMSEGMLVPKSHLMADFRDAGRLHCRAAQSELME